MIKPNVGVIVGRFQVNELHDGHLELFRAVRARHNRVLVFVGVAPTGITRRNPLDFETRKRMIQVKFPEFTVLPLADHVSDENWSMLLDATIGAVLPFGDVTLYGGRDSFVPHYKGKYKPVELALPPLSISASQIRDSLTNTIMQTPDFRAGVIYAANNMWPRVVTTVDVAIRFEDEILLAKKEGEKAWRFVGGHADPRSENFESDAKREVYEETGLDVIGLEYIGSKLIDDWRWKDEVDQIKTIFYLGQVGQQGARAFDDIAEVRWFNIKDLSIWNFVETHRPLWDMLYDHLKKEVKA